MGITPWRPLPKHYGDRVYYYYNKFSKKSLAEMLSRATLELERKGEEE
jgi:hypothetical protein